MSLIQKSILIIFIFFAGFLVFNTINVQAQQCNEPVCISNEKATTTNSTATITWNTNVPATSQVHWGPVLAGNCQAVNYTPINNTAVTNHSVTLSGLGSNATFCYNVISTAGGFTASGSTFNFTTSGSGGPPVRIDNFNVIQRTIPQTASSVDFKLTISQQDQDLDCSNLPFTNGNLEWVVWYKTLGDWTSVVRRQTVGLPLSPNPKNLDFSKSITPTARDIQNGSITFRAALGCTTYISENNLSSNLAVSSPIQVSISSGGGGGPPGGGGGPPGGGGGPPGTVTFDIPNPIAATSLVDLAKAIGKFIFQIAIPIAVIVIIYAGILFLTSGGNKEKVVKARTALWYAIIGLAIILIGQGFFTLIKSILNLGGPGP